MSPDSLLRLPFQISEPGVITQKSSGLSSYLVVSNEEELEVFAENLWEDLDIFGTTIGFLTAVKKLSEDIAPPEVRGDFRRSVFALKAMLPDKNIKVRTNVELSSYVDRLCESIALGGEDRPKVGKEIRYRLIRLCSGAGQNKKTPVILAHQIEDSIVPIEVFTCTERDHKGKWTNPEKQVAYLPKGEKKRLPYYRTLCLRLCPSDSIGRFDIRHKTGRNIRAEDSTFLGRLIPGKQDILRIERGTDESGDAWNEYNYARIEDIRLRLKSVGILVKDVETE
ncbi:MAG: hypothetical protein ACXABY_22360, partial [Candidatus Thorarchaeota archaeon]